MSRNLKIFQGEFYHLYNRGIEKRNIFSSRNDYDRFMALLYVSNGKIPVHLQLQGRTLKDVRNIDCGDNLVDLCAYCLMPNHFHLLVRGVVDNGVSLFMQKLTTGYTMYFNKRYERTGSLFEGKFKAVHANNDSYLKYVSAYIHLNPIKLIDSKWKEVGIKDINKAIAHLNLYTYSSYRDYIEGNRLESCILNKEALPRYLNKTKDIKDYFRDILNWNSNLEDVFKVEP